MFCWLVECGMLQMWSTCLGACIAFCQGCILCYSFDHCSSGLYGCLHDWLYHCFHFCHSLSFCQSCLPYWDLTLTPCSATWHSEDNTNGNFECVFIAQYALFVNIHYTHISNYVTIAYEGCHCYYVTWYIIGHPINLMGLFTDLHIYITDAW